MASNDGSGFEKLPFLSISEMRPTGQTASAIAIALLICASLTVGLRFFTRLSRQYSFDKGDVWLITGLCLFGGYCFALIRGLQTSGGTLARNEFTPWGVYNFYKYLYAIEILFTATITAIKISLLCLYISIFRTRQLLIAARWVMALCTAWFIAFMLVLIFQCKPIHAFWDLSLVASGQATCIPFGHILVAYEATNMAIDVVILSLPLFVIKSLQLPRTRKIICACLFSLGGVILLICAFRTYYLANITNSNATNIFSHGLNWSTAELATATICASVPTYGPYFNKIGQSYQRLSSKLGTSSWSVKFWYNKSRSATGASGLPDSSRPHSGKEEGGTEKARGTVGVDYQPSSPPFLPMKTLARLDNQTYDINRHANMFD